MRIRTGLPEDLDRITAVEAACFPPAEAATAEDFAGALLTMQATSGYWRMTTERS